MLPKGHALPFGIAGEKAGQHLTVTVLLCERAALSESLLSGMASTRLCRPPAAQQMTRHLSGPPARHASHAHPAAGPACCDLLPRWGHGQAVS